MVICEAILFDTELNKVSYGSTGEKFYIFSLSYFSIHFIYFYSLIFQFILYIFTLLFFNSFYISLPPDCGELWVNGGEDMKDNLSI